MKPSSPRIPLRRLTFATIALILLLQIVPAQSLYSQASSIPTSSTGLSGSRDVPMNIRVVFIGLSSSDINSTYLTNQIITPAEKPQSILAGAQGSGVLFKFSYQTQFADSNAIGNLTKLLNGIGKRVDAPSGATDPIEHLRNPYFDNVTTNISTVSNWFYDANQVGNWSGWSTYFGAGPIPGYTLFVADLHNYLPSYTYGQYQQFTTKCATSPTGQCISSTRGTATVHYYNRTVTEPDLHYVERRHFMTGWAVGQRSYFIDLSAGPSYWTNDVPIQAQEGAKAIAPNTWYSRYWTTKLVADYLAGAIYNLFSPDQLYPVNYSAKYVFHLFFFDDRNASETQPSMQNAVNMTMVKTQLALLVPYANVSVTTRFESLSSEPGLSAVVNNATTKTYDKASDSYVVDERLVYNWLSTYSEGHISRFINVSRTIDQIDIPAFIFAFTGKDDFGVSFKGNVFLANEPGSIYGEALGDLVLIGHSQRDLNAGDYPTPDGQTQPGKGIGYTRSIIHELGHMLGLNHPFLYDLDEDFVDSVMGYYANSLVYSQFDKDLILRGVNDELIIFAQVNLANTTSTLFNAGAISSAKQSMATADQKYSTMDYAGAVADSLAAAESAFQAHQTALGSISPGLVFGVIGLLAGIAVGLVAGFFVFKKRPKAGIQYYMCPTCGSALRWDPAISRWYCDRCQKPV